MAYINIQTGMFGNDSVSNSMNGFTNEITKTGILTGFIHLKEIYLNKVREFCAMS